MLLAAVTPRGLAGEETIVEITPMIGAGVGRIDGERLHGVDRLEDLLDLWPTPDTPAQGRRDVDGQVGSVDIDNNW